MLEMQMQCFFIVIWQMREGDILIGAVPTHIYKWVSVLKQGVEKVAKYWVFSLF